MCHQSRPGRYPFITFSKRLSASNRCFTIKPFFCPRGKVFQQCLAVKVLQTRFDFVALHQNDKRTRIHLDQTLGRFYIFLGFRHAMALSSTFDGMTV